MNLEDLGYSDFFESGRTRAGFSSYAPARVVAEHRGLYRVTDGTREYSGKITGKQMFVASSREDYPAVGDWVAISTPDPEHAVIHGVLPRKTVIKRKESGGSGVQLIAANVDVAFMVQAVGRDFKINRFERYAVMIASGGVRPSFLLNKSDLVPQLELEGMLGRIRARLPDIDVISVSTYSEDGLHDLATRLEKGKTYCFVGSSGVGKSSIINKLFGKEFLATGRIGSRTHRGKHITTARALFVLDGGAMVIDNPGMREFGVLESAIGVEQVFDTIVDIAMSCRFSDCTHTNEKGCAVRAAIESGILSNEQLESYTKLKRENEFHEMSDVERRKKDRAFGKFLKKSLAAIEKSKQ